MKSLTVKKIAIDGSSVLPQDIAELFSRKGIVYHPIAEDTWKCSDANPEVEFAIAHTGSHILLNFRLADNEVRAAETMDDGRGLDDSGWGYFRSPEGKDCYFSCECDPTGG